MRWRILWLLLCFVGFPAMADTVWLKNGDRLSGTIVLMDGGKLILETDYAGQVRMDWKDVETLSSEKPLLIKRDDREVLTSERLEASDAGTLRVVDDGSQTIPIAQVQQLIPPRRRVSDLVSKGNLDATLRLERNKEDSDYFKFKGDTRITHGPWRHLLNVTYEVETKKNALTENNWDAEYDLDRFFNQQWFWRLSHEQHRDQFDDVERWRGVGGGPGYTFWDNELSRFELIGRFNRINVHTVEGSAEVDGFSMDWDYKRLFWGARLEAYSKASLLMPTADEVTYLLDSEVGVRFRFNNRVRLSLIYEFDRLRGDVDTSSDSQFTLGFGVGW